MENPKKITVFHLGNLHFVPKWFLKKTALNFYKLLLLVLVEVVTVVVFLVVVLVVLVVVVVVVGTCIFIKRINLQQKQSLPQNNPPITYGLKRPNACLVYIRRRTRARYHYLFRHTPNVIVET